MCTIISKRYQHLVEYYETDAMKIVGHGAYIRWLEEARHRFYLDLGVNLSELERSKGIMIPMLSLSINYKGMCRYGEIIDIDITLERFNGVYTEFSYKMYGHNDENVRVLAQTTEGFMDSKYNPIMLQRSFPVVFEHISEMCEVISELKSRS